MDEIKEVYKDYHDRILSKRYNSPFWIRRYAHRKIYESVLVHVEPGQEVLDAGCGEGVLCVLLAQRGVRVVGIDISAQNIRTAREYARSAGMAERTQFLVGDAENLPFPDDSFDTVVSSHVLEHLPSFTRGLEELRRVTRRKAIIALPTCLNPCSWALLGRDRYWSLSKRSPIGIPLGLARTVLAFLRGEEGPDEGYTGRSELSHIFRFPWVMRRALERAGFRVDRFEASTLLIPYAAHYLPWMRSVQQFLDRYRGRRFLRLWGFGSVAVCSKHT